MDNPFENITAQLTAAREGTGLLGRPDYYGNEFAIQDSLDAALIAQQAQQIVNDPALLTAFLEENDITSESGDAAASGGKGTGPTIGIGTATDTITQDAVVAGLLGLITGGIPGALQGGAKSYITDTLAVLDQVNNTRDPIQALNALQGWTNTSLPAPVVSGKTNYNTPYDSSKDGRLNPAPVVSGKTNYNTPYGGSTSSGGGGGFIGTGNTGSSNPTGDAPI